MLKRNILSNFAAALWVGLLTLVTTPIFVHQLGVEAFGLIGFVLALQLLVAVLDLGLSNTITREVAADQSPGHVASQDLLRTSVTIYWSFAVAVAVLIAWTAPAFAQFWFSLKALDSTTVFGALQLAAVFLASRWPVALYSGALSGVQRLDVLNAIKIGAMSLRLVGGVLIVFAWPSLLVYFAWVAISSIVEVAAYAIAAQRVLPNLIWRPGFSLDALRAVWGLSLQLSGLAFLSMVLTQMDRLLIGKLLPLDQLGFYTIAYTAATAVSLVVGSMSSALTPDFSAAHGARAREALLSRYRSASEFTVYAAGLVAFGLAFFARPLLAIWINPVAAAEAAPVLSLLAIGFWFSASVSGAYTVSIACRRPGGPLALSAATGVLYVPLMYFMILEWGVQGAAAAWLVLNFGYVVTIVPWVHRYVLQTPVLPWYPTTLLAFAAVGCVTFGAGWAITVHWMRAGLLTELSTMILASMAYLALGYPLLGAGIRRDLEESVRRVATRLGYR